MGDADGLAGVGIDDTPHILIADDVAEVREVVRFYLERAGFRVSEATDGKDALKGFQQAVK